MRDIKRAIATILVLAGCLSIGFWIAHHKALWNDEFYSLLASINGQSYAGMFLGHIGEGNNTPLFYALQKAFLALVHYQTPVEWSKGNWSAIDGPSQILLRINPVVFMSLSMALVFFYFARRYSLLTALYSLFIYFSSYMLWVYWAEARPYTLVVFLTTVQSFLFAQVVEGREQFRRLWGYLAAAHILLGLTFILSLGQIWAVSLLLWAWGERDWRKYIFLTAVPTAIVLFYYSHAPKYHFWFNLSPEQLLRDNMSRDRFYILFIFALVWLAAAFNRRAGFAVRLNEQELSAFKPYFLFAVLTLLWTGIVLYLFGLGQTPGQGFPIPSRYFIYLTPIGVIAATWGSVAAVRSLCRYRLLGILVSAGIGVLLAQRFFKIVPSAIRSIMGG